MPTAAASIATTTWTTMMIMTVILILGSSSSSTAAAEEEKGLLQKSVVQITNGLTVPLTAHCQSKDDDIGEKVLAAKESFGWKFYPKIVPTTTLFFCWFEWEGSGGKHSFDIDKENRDIERCTVCQWAVYEKGPCLYNGATKAYDVCYPFKN